METAGKPVPPQSQSPAVLLVPPRWVAAGFFILSVVLFLTWWDQYPVQLGLFREYWLRNKRFFSPAWSSFVTTWIQNGVAMLLFVAVEAASWALGRRMLRWVLGVAPGWLWGALLALGLGNGLLGVVTLALGFNGLLMPGVFWVLLLASVSLAVQEVIGQAPPASRTRPADDLPTRARGLAPQTTSPKGGEGIRERGAGERGIKIAGWLERGLIGVCALVVVWSFVGLFMLSVSMLDRNTTTLSDSVLFVALAALVTGGWCAVGWLVGNLAGAVRWIERALIAFCTLIVVGNWLPTFQPEWFYDSMVYHLAVPEQYLLQHKVCYLSHTFISNYPFLQEMRYLFFLTLGDDIAPALLHWADGALVAAAVYALAEVFLGRTAAWLAAAIYLSQPTLRLLQPITMVELGLTWFEILATMAFVAGMGWLSHTANRQGVMGQAPSMFRARGAWFLLVGWFLGFAQGIKYIGLLTSILLLGWLCVSFIRSGRGGAKLGGTLALIVGWASLWMGVWLAKNWLFTADPLFPIHTIFPALNWDATLYEGWMDDNTKYGVVRGASLASWLKMPVRASIDTALFGTFTLNPFPLLFLPLLFLFRRSPEPIRFLAVYAGLYFVLWASSSQQTRFLYPMMAQAAVAIAFVVTRLGAGSWLLRGTLGVATTWILINAVYGEIHNRFSNSALVPYTTGHLDRSRFLRMGVPYYETVQKANEVMGKRSRLLFIGGDESYYCKRNRVCNSIYDRSWLGHQAERAKSPEKLLALLRRQRITHLLLHEPRCEEYVGYGIFDWGERAKENFLRMWHTYGRKVFVSKGVFLFELTAEPIPLSQRKAGRPTYFHQPEACQQSRELIPVADELFQKGQLAAAYRTCEELVSLVPGASIGYAYRGYANGLLNKRKEAIADYETAIRHGYPTGGVYFNLGVLLERERKYPEALKRYLGAIAMGVNVGAARQRATELAVHLKRYELALKLAEESAKANPSDPSLKGKITQIRQLAAAAQQ